MFIPVHISKTPSSERLLKLWAERYTVDVSSLSKNPKFYGELTKTALPEYRALTTAKLSNNVLVRTSNQAAIQAKSIYEYIPEIIDVHLGERIAEFSFQIYQKLLEFYQDQSGMVFNTINSTTDDSNKVDMVLFTIPNIEHLANQLEQLLVKYQDLHLIAKDWRVVGFLTTQFNFTNKLLLNQLTSVEKVLVSPYFKFIEEYVAVPWQRVCAAAAKHQQNSEALTLVEQMFSKASEISSTVYCQLLQLFPEHHGTRGGLGNPEVTHSCLRDLDMFQAYLLLCVLEGSQKPVKEELVKLCVMVMPSVGVKWEMIDKWKHILVNEIENRVLPQHKSLLLNYTQGMEEAFYQMRKQMGHKGELIEVPSDPG